MAVNQVAHRARLRTSPASQMRALTRWVSSLSGAMEQYSVDTAAQPPSAFTAEPRLGPRHVGPEAGAVRDLEEAVAKDERADCNRLEENVVPRVSRHHWMLPIGQLSNT